MTADRNSIEPSREISAGEQAKEDSTARAHGKFESAWARNKLHWATGIAQQPDCQHCGAVREGKFCKECGQRHLDDRLSLRPLLGELISRLTDLDRGLFHTFLCMFLRPGQVARDYISGNQRPYVNPLTYFLIGTAVQLLAYWTIEDILREQIQEGMLAAFPPVAPDAPPTEFAEKAGQTLPEFAIETYLSAIQQSYTYTALFCFVFPFAFLLGIFHRAIDEDFRMGETMVFSLFIFGQILLVTGVLTPFTLHLGSTLHGFMGPTVYIAVAQMGHTGFFESTWTSRLMTLLATALCFIPFVLSIVFIFAVTFGLKYAWIVNFS